VGGKVTVDEPRVRCNQNPNKPPVIDRVRWQATENVEDWRVIFGSYAPTVAADAEKPSKVASPENDTLHIADRRRPEDLGHWKYVVVAKCKDGSLGDLDPEMIVDD
jgi:hypothetical protein